MSCSFLVRSCSCCAASAASCSSTCRSSISSCCCAAAANGGWYDSPAAGSGAGDNGGGIVGAALDWYAAGGAATRCRPASGAPFASAGPRFTPCGGAEAGLGAAHLLHCSRRAQFQLPHDSQCQSPTPGS
eukprot:5852193-Prymnesium_polylepis.1